MIRARTPFWLPSTPMPCPYPPEIPIPQRKFSRPPAPPHQPQPLSDACTPRKISPAPRYDQLMESSLQCCQVSHHHPMPTFSWHPLSTLCTTRPRPKLPLDSLGDSEDPLSRVYHSHNLWIRLWRWIRECSLPHPHFHSQDMTELKKSKNCDVAGYEKRNNKKKEWITER